MCQAGSCVCPAGQLGCGTGGACIDILENDTDCGACGNACPSESECNGGECQCFIATETPCPDGCADLQEDESNCGGCGLTCTSSESCLAGECRCPAPIVGAEVSLGYGHRNFAFAELGDGRVAWASASWARDDQKVSLYILNVDGTVAAGPHVVFQTTLPTAYDGEIYVLDMTYDGSQLGILFSQDADGSVLTYVLRTTLDGTVTTAPRRIDEDRGPGHVWYNANSAPSGLNSEVWEEVHQLYYDPTVGYMALTVDRRDYDGPYLDGWAFYTRLLGPDATATNPSRRVFTWSASGVYIVGGVYTRTRYLPGGDLDVFVASPGTWSDTETALLRLNASGGPRASTLTFDAFAGGHDVAAGVAIDGANQEVLFGERATTTATTGWRWRYGTDYGSSRSSVLDVDWPTRISSGTAGVILYRGASSDFRLERIRRTGPGQWEHMDQPVTDLPGPGGTQVAVAHTGTDSALIVSRGRIFPVQFSYCP